ncbi:hypothetical protein M569_09637 [Genlisea aurea]|uniref:Uncharacterized protein n=1 Tax=Genlisea aurea TaxID=192259 RepID=S8DYN9_9LAMI|nr:hypothetical protein M569_09637 [Genlisea aurea]
MCSSDEHAEARVPMPESKFCRTEDNLAESPPGSCSWGSSDLLSDSDDPNSGMAHGESHRKGLNGTKSCRNSKSGEKLCKGNVGAQYMSYVKISKEQHELFKNSSLSDVLGIIDPLDVQPFERFEEEEKAKLHAHWIKMVADDIHKGFISMRKKQTHRRESLDCLAKEIGEKLILEARRDDDEGAVSLTKSVEPFTVFDGEEEGIQMLPPPPPPSDSDKVSLLFLPFWRKWQQLLKACFVSRVRLKRSKWQPKQR